MQNQDMNQNMKIQAAQRDRKGNLWMVPAEKGWKIRLNDENSATAIYRGMDVYRIENGRVFNVRDRYELTDSYTATSKILPLVYFARNPWA